MSLRAKIEAVIYAAEEPVTLAQLSVTFGAEALVVRAERLGNVQYSGGHEAPATLFPVTPASGQTAESAADEHAGALASDSTIEQAVEHPEQVYATQPDGFAGEPEALSVGMDDDRRLTRQREREAREEIRRTVDELIAEYDANTRGMEIREIAGGYRVATRPEYHDAVRGFVKSLKSPMKLSLQALETLAVIAYKQPVTAPEVSDIRGVDAGGVLGSLISRKLVTTAGRKQVIGRPILYKTTKEFLLRFGLKDLAELPSMEEFEKMAGELAEPEPGAQVDLAASVKPASPVVQGETPMQSVEPEESHPLQEGVDDEPTAAEGAPSAPALTEAREQAELEANARANIKVDDERAPHHDLPGVNRDTAGRVNIDSRTHAPFLYDEGDY